MKKLIYPTVIALLMTVSAHAEGPDNDASGAGVLTPGFEKCEVCQANASARPLQVSKSYDALLPDAGASNAGEDSSAPGTK